MGLTVVLQNHEGVRFKMLAIPYFRHEIYVAQMARLKLQVAEDDLADIVPVRRRVFEFWDREGELYIYTERWEKC